MKIKIDSILVDKNVEHLPTTQSILQKLGVMDVTVIEDVRAVKRPMDFSKAKKTLLITENKGHGFKPCQGMTSKNLCCNYWVIDLVSNCLMDCSYCILQYYLKNNPMLTIYANVDEIATRASIHFAKNNGRKFRVGTGELSDSLALDHVTGFSKKLIKYFSAQKNVSLELKTKTTNIEHLLNIGDKGNTVISWSVNSNSIIASEEHGSPSLEERLDAAMRAGEAGYNIGFHFDPIIYGERWEEEYEDVARRITDGLPHEKIAWISLGTLRFPVEMKDIVMRRFPKSRIFSGELVYTNGKARYFRPIREKMYRKMIEFLSPLKRSVPIYLCMETMPVWQNVIPEVLPTNASIEAHLHCRQVFQPAA